METFVRNSRRRRSRRKKKMSRFPSRCLSTSKLVIRREKSKKMKKKTRQLADSLIKGFCEQHISLSPNYEKDLTEFRQWEENIFERTIDLSDSESSTDDSKSSVLVVPSFEVQRTNDVIDHSKDLPDQNEIIDLTEAVNMARGCCSVKSNLEPTVIDISEDDLEEQSNCKLDNDEIFVIGTFNKNSNLNKKCETNSFIPVSNKWNNFNKLNRCNKKLRRKFQLQQSVLDKIDNKKINLFEKGLRKRKENFPKVGQNIYVNSPVTFPSNGLRPIIIDGSNVAFVHSDCNFSCKRLEICINYFKEKGHRVTAFVPQYRINSHRSDDPQLLKRLERQGDVILTPSKKIDGRNVVPYDDRFIVQTAVLKGGIIVTRDNYNDLLKENPAWAETIKYRTLAFTWVDDVLMFPEDPLGEYGPSLEEFLRFH